MGGQGSRGGATGEDGEHGQLPFTAGGGELLK